MQAVIVKMVKMMNCDRRKCRRLCMTRLAEICNPTYTDILIINPKLG